MMKTTNNLTEGSILKILISFTIPILLSMLLQTAYGTADLYIVGQFSDISNVSGVSIGSMLSQNVINFCVGLSMGTTVLISRYIGSGEKTKASKVMGVSILGFTVLAIVCTVGITLLSDELVTIMNVKPEAYDAAKSYLFISGLGCIFIVFYNLLGSIFRGIGDSKTPLLTVFVACITNIVLDLILVGYFKMGATGAAIATVVAQAISVLMSLIVIMKRGLPFEFNRSYINFDLSYFLSILKIGIPSALQMLLSGLSFLVLSSLMNEFSMAASAAVGIVGKVTGIILVVPQSFSQSLAPFTAQNMGANKTARANKALLYAIAISMLIGTITGYLSFFHGEIFIRMFTNEPDAIAASLSYLKSYSPDCILVAIMFCLAGYLNGREETTFVMFQSILGSFLIRIPFSYLFSTFENTSLFLIGLAIPISTLIQILVTLVYMRRRNILGKSVTSNTKVSI